MVVPYYIKLFHTRADRYNGILMSLLLLVAEAIIKRYKKILSRKNNSLFYVNNMHTLYG